MTTKNKVTLKGLVKPINSNDPFNCRQSVILQRSDFTSYAADDLGIWGALTNDDPNVECVEVRVIRKEV